jgi:hypothetical protein
LIISNIAIAKPNFQAQYQQFTTKITSPVSMEVDKLRSQVKALRYNTTNLKRKVQRRDAKLEVYENLLKNVLEENNNYIDDQENNDMKVLSESTQGTIKYKHCI